MIQGKILILKWFLCLFIRAMKVTIFAKIYALLATFIPA